MQLGPCEIIMVFHMDFEVWFSGYNLWQTLGMYFRRCTVHEGNSTVAKN